MGNHSTTDLLTGETLIGHPGEAYGLISDMYFSKEGKYGIIFMTNGGLWGYGTYSGWYNIEEEVFKACLQYMPQLELTAVRTGAPNTEKQFSLKQNYPNPFNAATKIQYQISETTHVRLQIYNMSGQLVATIADEDQSPGEYTAIWNAGDNPSGLYIYKLETSHGILGTGKLVLMR